MKYFLNANEFYYMYHTYVKKFRIIKIIITNANLMGFIPLNIHPWLVINYWTEIYQSCPNTTIYHKIENQKPYSWDIMVSNKIFNFKF
jgi:hypothetical protein